MARVSWTYDWVNSSLFRKLARSWTSTRDFVISKGKFFARQAAVTQVKNSQVASTNKAKQAER